MHGLTALAYLPNAGCHSKAASKTANRQMYPKRTRRDAG
jgi:hypothetical protein